MEAFLKGLAQVQPLLTHCSTTYELWESGMRVCPIPVGDLNLGHQFRGPVLRTSQVSSQLERREAAALENNRGREALLSSQPPRH